MKIITKEFEMLFKNYPLYSQEDKKDPLVVAKLFVGNITWYLTEYNQDTQVAFGYVTGMAYDEFGYIYIPELETTKIQGFFEVERDLYFTQRLLSTFIKRD